MDELYLEEQIADIDEKLKLLLRHLTLAGVGTQGEYQIQIDNMLKK